MQGGWGGQKDANSPPLPKNTAPLFLVLHLLSAEGSLGEIQTLQECYHCVAVAAFPSSFNTLQTPHAQGACVYFPSGPRACPAHWPVHTSLHIFGFVHLNNPIVAMLCFPVAFINKYQPWNGD